MTQIISMLKYHFSLCTLSFVPILDHVILIIQILLHVDSRNLKFNLSKFIFIKIGQIIIIFFMQGKKVINTFHNL